MHKQPYTHLDFSLFSHGFVLVFFPLQQQKYITVKNLRAKPMYMLSQRIRPNKDIPDFLRLPVKPFSPQLCLPYGRSSLSSQTLAACNSS